ncbi:hypothetical protein, partial [Salmonella sp. s51228]|uniref:hypothetical protein n=1 Tax=Salmonella sp. s51228 TaxID=3159652 RepID=UPI00397FC324
MNTTIYANQSASNLFGYKLDDWSEQLYSSSRQWLVSELREFLTDDTAATDEQSEEANMKIEQQLMDTFDNLFKAFRDLQNASTSTNALIISNDQNATSWEMISNVFNSISTSSILAFLK